MVPVLSFHLGECPASHTRPDCGTTQLTSFVIHEEQIRPGSCEMGVHSYSKTQQSLEDEKADNVGRFCHMSHQ